MNLRRTLSALTLGISSLLWITSAQAANSPLPAAAANGPTSEIAVSLIGIGPGAGAFGTVEVTDDPTGPDKLDLRIESLPADSRISVFLTRHPQPGRLPIQFIGEFTTDAKGRGRLKLRAEIVNAFTAANQSLADLSGDADDPTAGNLPGPPVFGSANTISLNFFRGYFADIFPHNVFGPDENTPGGAPAFVSNPALP